MRCNYSYDKQIIFFFYLYIWNEISEFLFLLLLLKIRSIHSLNDTLLEFVSCEQKLIEVCIALKVCPLYNRQIIFRLILLVFSWIVTSAWLIYYL